MIERLDALEQIAVEVITTTYQDGLDAPGARFWVQKGIEGMRLAIALDHQESAEGSVREERLRQDEKWGEQNHGDEIWLTVLMEELGEAAQEVLTHRNPEHGNGHGDLRSEVVQIAAVAVAWLEALDRRVDD